MTGVGGRCMAHSATAGSVRLMGSRIADDRCPDCGHRVDEHDRIREQTEDGQFVFTTRCPTGE